MFSEIHVFSFFSPGKYKSCPDIRESKENFFPPFQEIDERVAFES